MMRTDTVRAKVSHRTKVDAESVLSSLGLTMSQAIHLMLIQVILRKALPFNVAIPNEPNAETQKALEATEKGEGLIKCKDVDDLFNKTEL